MSKINKLEEYALMLIRQKRIIRSTHYLLIISFISLSLGVVLALPLRYYLGLSFEFPLFVYIVLLLLSFIYGFLGIIEPLDILKETDLKMSLNERLSAAFQFVESENPYSELLANEAEVIMEKLKVNQVYKIRLSRRDPFQPLLLALFLFLWMSSFSFLQISDATMVTGDMLIDASLKIDAVNSGNNDKDIEDIAEEYKKLGQKIQDQFMNDQSIENEVEELSRKLERKIEELSRKGADKDSRVFEKDEESEIYQLNRKEDMSDALSDILESLMKTFSISPDSVPGGVRKGEGGTSGEGDRQQTYSEERNPDKNAQDSPEDSSDESTAVEETSELDQGTSDELPENLNEGDLSSDQPGLPEGMKDDEASGTEQNPSSSFDPDEEEMVSDSTPGSDSPEDISDFTPFKKQRESGEFDDENIRGELQEGEQMKSFIRALPHIVEPTLEEMDILHFYRNQLENAVDKEILPEGYQRVIRDYFLSIGVLNE